MRSLMYVNLIYLMFLVFPLVLGRNVSSADIAVTLASVVIYLPLHFAVYRAKTRTAMLCATAMVLLALCVIPFNPSGNTYVIYGVIAAAYRVQTRRAIMFLVLALLLVAVEVIYVGYPIEWLIFTIIFSSALVAQAIYGQRIEAGRKQLQLSQQEVQRLARLAERERISRDLHDVLGHTMSLIVMKSELAHRLVARQPDSAAAHMQEVEMTARAALQQIREAVSGMRNIKLAVELEDAQATLLSAGIKLRHQQADLALSNVLETTLALAVREAVTNIIRHSKAKNVDIILQGMTTSSQLLLEIKDDGSGGEIKFGNGLIGMRERIELIGGRLEVSRTANGGTCLALVCANVMPELTQKLVQASPS
jgi:two-component system, NarL family, sensor histidine kinase DesK